MIVIIQQFNNNKLTEDSNQIRVDMCDLSGLCTSIDMVPQCITNYGLSPPDLASQLVKTVKSKIF